MKPINSVRSVESAHVPVKSEFITTQGDKKFEEAWLLDALRNTYISENSSLIFCTDPDFSSEPLGRISAERQRVVEQLVNEFSYLTMEEKLFFFLRIPVNHSHGTYESKLNVLASRVEIRRTAAWIRSHLQVDNDSSIPKRDVYDKYMEYCQSSRMIPISIADFGKVMKHMYPSVRPRRLGTRGKSQYCYSGMSSCQNLKRPDLYDETHTSFIDEIDFSGSNPTFEQQYVEEDFSTEEYQSNPILTYAHINDDTDLCVEPKYSKSRQFQFSQDSSAFERKCRQRKALLCNRTKFRKPCINRSLKDVHLFDHNSDCQVEEEIAQYFPSDNVNAPEKFLTNNTPSIVPFNRSLSYTGASSIQYLDENRSQSVAIYPRQWTSDENFVNRHSASCISESIPYRSESREATEKLSQLKLRSQSTQNCLPNCESNSDMCGFTPITPSPIPWTTFNSTHQTDSHIFMKPENTISQTEPLSRPRSLSTETKSNLKRDFQHAFAKPIERVDAQTKPLENEAYRSQSLPSFQKNHDHISLTDQPLASTQNISTITCQELSSIFTNSDNICFENMKIEDNLLPSQDVIISQLDGILNGVKTTAASDIIGNNSKVGVVRPFEVLPQDSLPCINVSQDIFKSISFDQFF